MGNGVAEASSSSSQPKGRAAWTTFLGLDESRADATGCIEGAGLVTWPGVVRSRPRRSRGRWQIAPPRLGRLGSGAACLSLACRPHGELSRRSSHPEWASRPHHDFSILRSTWAPAALHRSDHLAAPDLFRHSRTPGLMPRLSRYATCPLERGSLQLCDLMILRAREVPFSRRRRYCAGRHCFCFT